MKEMDKLVSIGVNNVPKYLYYIPLVKWAWEQFGWRTIIFHVGPANKLTHLIDKISEGKVVFDVRQLSEWDYPSETVAQVLRFYAYSHTCSFIMLSDSDMIPLSDYWNPHPDNVTCYGRDLSDEHYPCCYVAMSSKNWRNVMGDKINQVKFDLKEHYPKAKNKWTTDQNILTEKLSKIEDKILIDRGIDPKTNYPIGRVDRSRWSLNHTQLIDAHLPHDILTNDESYKKVCALLSHVWPTQDFSWYHSYHKEFKKLL